MKQWLGHPLTIRAARFVIGLIFLAAGLAKIGDMDAFAGQIHNFRLLPVSLENLAAMTLPWIEVIAGLALVLNLRGRSAAWLATAMLAAFTVAIVTAVARDLSIECGCFGKADAAKVGWKKILENVGMLGVAALASFPIRRR